jgi:hypothetical protein
VTRLHHDRFTEAIAVPDEIAARRAQAGIDHEQIVVDALSGEFGDRIVHIDPFDDPHGATNAALLSGVDLIVGGRILSSDQSLVGAPDILIRADTGYVAVEVKSHLVLGSSGYRCAVTPIPDLFVHPSALASANGAGAHDDQPPAQRFRGVRKRDLFQVAHYWNILDSLGFATKYPYGGVIGTEDPLTCAWVDFSAGDPPIIDRATDFASEALDALRTGSTNPARPAVAPYWRGECHSCLWQELCLAELAAAEDPTLLSGVSPETRAELALAGVTAIPQVADLPTDTELLPDAEPILVARAHTAGRLLRRQPSNVPVDVPRPAREVDFDIETYRGRIYLAGFLETVDETTTFKPITDWSGEEPSERALITELFERLASYSDDNTTVFHWTKYEPKTLTEAAERWDLTIPGFPSVDAWFEAYGVDLHRWTKQQFVSASGYGLKAIAPQCGFHWRDDDPGGQQSEIWFEEMLAGDRSMRTRLLAYNEDDVAAQLAIRRWIVESDAGDGPGTAIPSATDWPIN